MDPRVRAHAETDHSTDVGGQPRRPGRPRTDGTLAVDGEAVVRDGAFALD
jgi:hypothetical protein